MLTLLCYGGAMSKIVLNSLSIVALALIVAAFTSCTSKKKASDNVNKVKLLESIINADDKTVKLEYDAQNRISKKSGYDNGKLSFTETFAYGKNGSVKSVRTYYYDVKSRFEVEFVRNGNMITVPENEQDVADYHVNDDGYLMKEVREVWEGTYHYQGGNVTKITGFWKDWINDTTEDVVMEYKYDDKKSPFFNDKTPKWLIKFLFSDYGLTNNIIEHNHSAGLLYTYKYEYDSDGFPTKQTALKKYKGKDDGRSETQFIYRSE